MTRSFASCFSRPCSSATRSSGNTSCARWSAISVAAFEIDLLRLLDQRIDDVGLPALLDLAAHERVDLVAPRLGPRRRGDRLPSGRHLAHDRHVEIAVGRERERARDRRRGHDQHVGMQALRAQRRALQHAEPVLLVDDRQPELAERDVLLHERVRADHQVQRAAGELREQLAALPRRRAAGQQRDPEARRLEQPADVEVSAAPPGSRSAP